MTKFDLSIIIVTWNTADITIKCVKTIKKYIEHINYEIIVVDNGSEDDTVARLNKIGHLKIVENKANLGFSKANNIGVKKAEGEYLLFLNSDMEFIDSSLELMFEYIKKNPEIGAIGPKFLNIDLTTQASVFPPQTIFNAIKEYWLSIPSYSKYSPLKLANVWSISGGAILIKKDFFEKIGGWNEKYFFYFEDMDLCRSIHQQHKNIVYFPDCKVIHRHGASGSKLASASNQWRRLIPSSIKYHGYLNHYILTSILWSGQKWQKLKNIFKK